MDEHVHHEAHVDESTDVPARPLILFFVVFLLFTAFAFYVVKWSYHALVKFENARQGDVPTRVEAPRSEIPKSLELFAGGPEVKTLPENAPMLQADPVRDMKAMRTEHEAKLASYGWIDREKGVVHIPIEKAMTFTLERAMVKAQAAEPAAAAVASAAAGTAPAAAAPTPAPAAAH